MIKNFSVIVLLIVSIFTLYSFNCLTDKETMVDELIYDTSEDVVMSDSSEWFPGSWGITFPVYGGERLDTEIENNAYDYRAGAQEIVDELPAVGHVMTNLSYFAHSQYFTLRQNDNVDIAAEIHESLVPSLENEQIIFDVLQTFKDAGEKVILYISTDYMDEASAETQEAWVAYYTSKFGGDEYAAYENLIEGFIKRIGHLVDAYWLDTTSSINADDKMDDFFSMIKAADPGALVSANTNKNYFKDEDGYIMVDTDGFDDKDTTDYKIIKHEPMNEFQDFTHGHVTPIGQGAPVNSWGYDEFTLPNMIANPLADYEGKTCFKHAWFPVRKRWHVATEDLVYEVEQAYRFVKSITDANATITFANTTDYGLWNAGYMMHDEMLIMKEINDRLLMETVPDFEPYVRPEGALLVGESLPDDFQYITFSDPMEKQVGDASFVPSAVASSGLPVSYTSSDTSVAVVIDGEIHIVSAGTTIINASQPGNAIFSAALSKTQTLTVAQESSNIFNLALSGTATQSADHPDGGGAAQLAIDGNIDGRWSKGSVTRTAIEYDPWWQVDLGTNCNIGRIKIFSRTDACCNQRLVDFSVFVLNSNGDTVYSNYYESYVDTSMTIDLGGVQGQIIKIQLYTSVATGVLNIAEVQVFEMPNEVSLQVVDELTNNIIPNASLAIAGKFYTANSQGEIMMSLSNGQYDFSLIHPAYLTLDQSLVVIKDSTVVIGMTAKKEYELSFQVRDDSTQVNLSGVQFLINGATYTSDSIGEISLSLYEGVYDYELSCIGYNMLSQTINLEKDTLITLQMDREIFSLVFQLSDFSTSENLYNVELSINDEIYVSDSLGAISLDLYEAYYDYELSISGYDSLIQFINLEKDTLVVLQMNKETLTLVFQVEGVATDENVSQAIISFDNTLYGTDDQGILSLDLYAGEYDYTVSMDGYDDGVGSLLLSKDSTVVIVLPAVSAVTDLRATEIDIYPNPIKDVLMIDIANAPIANYEIYTIAGESVMAGHLVSGENCIAVEALLSGIYMVRVVRKEEVMIRKIIVQ